MTNKDDEDFENSTKCWICKKEYEKGKVKVKDHYHITGKYKVSPHQECNLNLSLIKKIPVVFPNFQNYYSHIIFQEIGKSDFKINFIPKTIKKNMSCNIQQPKKESIKSGLPLVFRHLLFN